jgi:hypothetical protein
MFVQHLLRTLVCEEIATLRLGDKSRSAPKRRGGVKHSPELRVKFQRYAEAKSFAPAVDRLGQADQPPVHTEAMMSRISKAIVAGVSALAMAAAVVLPTAPASAGGFGGGGFHGGGFHGGGWHGGGWHGGGWHGGWAGGRSWHPGYWRGGVWYGGWWGPAIAAGILTGAAIASAPYWAGGYGYGGGCWQVRPTYDGYGNYLGDQSVNVC